MMHCFLLCGVLSSFVICLSEILQRNASLKSELNKLQYNIL